MRNGTAITAAFDGCRPIVASTVARLGAARHGTARRGLAWRGKASTVARRGAARRGLAGQGLAWAWAVPDCKQHDWTQNE